MNRNNERREQMKRRRDESDDPKVLKDGESFRVPMMMMDSAAPQRTPRFRPTPERITDAFDTPFGLNKPGYRVATGGELIHQALDYMVKEDRCELYAGYERELTDAWRDPDRTGVGSRGSGPDEDAMASTDHDDDDMDEIYRARDRELENEWRKG
jgi:hypothetical protein